MDKVLSKQLSQSHFRLGNDHKAIIPTYLDHYPPLKAVPQSMPKHPSASILAGENDSRIKFSKDILSKARFPTRARGNRNHNYLFGNQKISLCSVAQQDYTPKQIQAGQNLKLQQQKAKMRTHHHIFQQSQNSVSLSNYNQNYRNYEPQPPLHLNVLNSIRSSHIKFGQYESPKCSTNMCQYAPKLVPKIIATKPQFMPLKLGAHQYAYESSNSHFMKQFIGCQVQKLPAQKIRKLKDSYFQLGQHKSIFQSQSQAHFTLNKLPPHRQPPRLKDTPQLTRGLDPDNYTSAYNHFMQNFKGQPAVSSPISLSTNFQLGHTYMKKQSQTTNQFVQKTANPGLRAAGIICNDKPNTQDSIIIGSQKFTNKSVAQVDYALHQQPKKIQIKQGGKAMGKSSFRLGSECLQGVSEYKDEFRKAQKEKLKQFHARMFKAE